MKEYVKDFYFFPKSINRVVRWLEYAEWEDDYMDTIAGIGYWSAFKWLDLKDEEQ